MYDDNISIAETEATDNLRWIPHPTEVWCVADIGDEVNGQVECEVIDIHSTDSTTQAPSHIVISKDVLEKETYHVEDSHFQFDTHDISKIYGNSASAHEGPALSHLKSMFNKSKVYTMLSDILIAVNPCKQLPGTYDDPMKYCKAMEKTEGM